MVFQRPPRVRELGEATDQSYWSIRRLVVAGIAPTHQFPDGKRIDLDFANRYAQRGLTDDERTRLIEYGRRERQRREAKAGAV